MDKDISIKLNEAINIIKEECKSQTLCTECPMNYNCNLYPAEWEEVKDGED